MNGLSFQNQINRLMLQVVEIATGDGRNIIIALQNFLVNQSHCKNLWYCHFRPMIFHSFLIVRSCWQHSRVKRNMYKSIENCWVFLEKMAQNILVYGNYRLGQRITRKYRHETQFQNSLSLHTLRLAKSLRHGTRGKPFEKICLSQV